MTASDIQPITALSHERLINSVIDYAIYMLNPSGVVASWNPGAERIKGYAATEIVGQHFSRFYTGEEREAGVPEGALRQARETGRFTAEAWRVRKDGSRFWALVVIDAIRDDAGAIVGFAKITRDMTEQREAQLASLEAERRFRLLVRGVTDYAIYMLDPEGRVSNWNLGAERIKGYAEAEIVGHPFSRFYTPDDVASGLPARALDTARREGRFEAEGWRLRKSGERFWAGVVIDPIHDEAGELIGFAKITRDLTERREQQARLEESREQLFQAQKMEALGQLTGGVAHDFNNLLTGISGSLELIQSRVAQGRTEELERYVVAAQGAARRAASLTERLLAFSRRQTLDPRPTDLNRLVADMEDLVRRSIGPGVALEIVAAPGLWSTLVDPPQLDNALLNLCINARDAMPEGGRLTIETANVVLSGRAAKTHDLPAGRYVTLRVADTGAGMPAEVLARAFDPFFTTKPLGTGTGLGLSMVYGFVRQSGGQVRITSEPGAGTSVRIHLPYHSGAEAGGVRSGGEAARERPPASGRTVLVVDDEPTVRMLAAEVAEAAGHAVMEASEGASALSILQSDAPVDLLIADIGLPGGMNGRQLVESARALRPGLGVLFITGYAEAAAAGEGLLGPGMSVLTKPFALEQLDQRLKAVFG